MIIDCSAVIPKVSGEYVLSDVSQLAAIESRSEEHTSELQSQR